MRSSTALVVVLAAVMALGGCQQWNKMMGKDDDATKKERVSMTALPEPVRNTFNKEFPAPPFPRSIARSRTTARSTSSSSSRTRAGQEEVEYDATGKRMHEEK